jgi:hypothetical protein
VQSITPANGPLSGGTVVTIRGLGFAAGATVTIGARAATDVTVTGSDALTARTPAGAASSAVDVVVTVSGRAGLLSGGFQYDAAPPNTAPVITSLTAAGTRSNEPPSFADWGEVIRLTAVVTDAETPVASLEYEWQQACGGTIRGTGAQVEFQAPFSATSATCTIRLIVADGPHLIERSVVINLHNSVEEVRALTLQFLDDFADSSIAPATVVRNFSDKCEGKKAELDDVAANRKTRLINSHEYGVPSVTIRFGGVCAFRSRPGDACAATTVKWQSTILATKQPETTTGTSHITAVYERPRWWLCRSEFQGSSSSGLTFMN